MASDAEPPRASHGQPSGVFANLYEHRGTYYDPFVVPEDKLLAVPGYDDVRADDVFVWTYPKAGTHLICDVTLKILHNGSVEKDHPCWQRDVTLEISSPKNLAEEFLAKGVVNRLAAGTLEELSNLPSPRVILTHLPYDMLPQKVQDGQAKLIYVYRDPRDIAVSMWHQLNTLRSHFRLPALQWHDFLERYQEGRVNWGLWSRHFKSCQTVMDKPHVLVLYYEQIVQDLKGAVQKIASFLGKQLTQDAIEAVVASSNFDAAKKARPNSVYIRKGVAGDWKGTFTVAQAEEFNAHMIKEVRDLGLSIPYQPL